MIWCYGIQLLEIPEQTMLSPDEWKSREWPRIAFGWSREAEWAATIRYAWLRMIERVSEPSFLRFLQLACFREMRNNPLFVMHTCFRRRTERKGEEEEKKRTIGGEGEGRRKRNSQVESGRPPLATENASPRGAKYANDALKRDIFALGAIVEIRWYHLESYCFPDAARSDGVDHLGLVGRR